MALKKITEAEMNEQGVCAAPDQLKGTVQENKAVFDRMVRNLVAPAYNACAEAVDQVNAQQGQWAAEESGRVTAEEARETAEKNRASAEKARAAAETARASAEESRAAAEAARVTAENVRSVWDDYDHTKAYVPGNKVVYNGSSYLNIASCDGVLPSNPACWRMIAKRGADGNGAGDMRKEIYDPDGKEQNVYQYAEELARLPEWNAVASFEAGAMCYWAGEVWRNTSGAAAQGVEPGSNYGVWNVPYSNPNLLDNAWFADPVNQRGDTSYDTSGKSGYTIDRWWSIFATVALSDGIVITDAHTASAYSGILCQAAGDPSGISGKKVTLSINVTAVTGGEATVTVVKAKGINAGMVSLGSFKIGSAGIHTKTYDLPDDVGSSDYPYLVVSVNTAQAYGASIALRAAKLELGSISTMANDGPPNKAAELAKCQRYYKRLDGIWWMHPDKDDISRVVIPLNPPMRTVPSITFSAADGSTGTICADENIRTEDMVQFYATGVTGICGVKDVICTCDL